MATLPPCTHLATIVTAGANTEGCEECLRDGTSWVHLRRCTACGHVGCCDSSPGRHATAHFGATDHPLVQSFEPGEDWIYCYVDDLGLELPEMADSPSHP